MCKYNLYKVTIHKGITGEYVFYVVARSHGEAETVASKRPKDWSLGKVLSIKLILEPVLIPEEINE